VNTADPDVARLLDEAVLLPALATVQRPAVTIEVLVAGSKVLRHRVWVDGERAVLVLAVRPGHHQVMVLPPGHLGAALVRMTRVGPRRGSGGQRRTVQPDAPVRLLAADPDVRRAELHEVGATLAWRLRVGWDGEHRDLVAIDGPDGLSVVDDEAGVLLPVSATSLYRVFSTVLPHSSVPGSAPSSASASVHVRAASATADRGRSRQ
jgi:hypothetical protein